MIGPTILQGHTMLPKKSTITGLSDFKLLKVASVIKPAHIFCLLFIILPKDKTVTQVNY
jgi:hypothetical protein